MLQYKVLTDHDKRFSGNFDGDALETTLNRYAAVGEARALATAVAGRRRWESVGSWG